MASGRLTHIEAAHKGDLLVNDAQLLVVGPEQHPAVARAVYSFESVYGGLGDARGVEGKVLEAGGEVLGEVIAGGGVVGVSEDGDIGVQRLEVMTGVLRRVM